METWTKPVVTDLPADVARRAYRAVLQTEWLNTGNNRARVNASRRGAAGRAARARYFADPTRREQHALHVRQARARRSPEQRLLTDAKNRSREFERECTITLTDVVIPEACPICLRSFGPRGRKPSLDRIDNVRGYVPGNVAVICYGCNSRKGSMTLEYLARMAAYMKGSK